MTREPILDATGVAKNYGAVAALKNASLSVLPGEVHALMGANGAGKSTLVKILTGAISANGGRILLRGEERDIRSPASARKAGLVPVYQEPSLIPDLDVLSNLRLTQTPVEPFREWVRELGVPILDLRDAARDVPLAIQILDGQKPASQTVLVEPALWENVTDAGKEQLKSAADPSLSPEWPVSISIKDWTSYTKDQIVACKGPGE